MTVQQIENAVKILFQGMDMTDSGKKVKGWFRTFIIGFVIIVFFGIVLIAFLLGGWVLLTKKQQKENRVLTSVKKTQDAKDKVRQFEAAVLKFYKKECRFPKSAASLNKKARPDAPNSRFGELNVDDIQLYIAYFQYRLVNEDRRLTIIAENDFFPETSKKTSHTLVLNAGPDCTVRSGPIVTILEEEAD